MLWLLRLSPVLGRTPSELAEQLTAADLALYQALVEIDGPWWGARETAHLTQLCSVQAAAAGADLPPEKFEIEWHVGPTDEPVANLLPAAEGLAIFAARHGADITTESPP